MGHRSPPFSPLRLAGESGRESAAHVVEVPPKTRSESAPDLDAFTDRRTKPVGQWPRGRPPLSSAPTESPLPESSFATVIPAGPVPTITTS